MPKRIADHSGFFDTDQQFVLKLLDEWQPSPACKTEKNHEVHLQTYLQQRLPDVPIVAQYGIAKGKADLVIEDRHVIELKLAFDIESVAEFDRCIGQLERYRQKWLKPGRGPVYLVVVGQSDAEFRDLLHVWFDEMNPTFNTIIESPRLHLLEKLIASP